MRPLNPRRRAVIVVPNPAAPYSRALRIARSLAAHGFDTEIVAVAADGLPREERHGDVVLHRHPAGGGRETAKGLLIHAPTGVPGSALDATPHRVPRDRGVPSRSLVRRSAGRVKRALQQVQRWVLWPHGVRGWWKALDGGVAPADLYHACGIQGLGGALALAAKARRAGRAGQVVYDVIDLAVDSHLNQAQPRLVRAWYHWRERAWVRRTAAVVTVNDHIAHYLERQWQLADPPTVLLNCPPTVAVDDPPEPLIREAARVPEGRRLVLFLGRFGPERGLDTAAEAIVGVPDAALVLIGFGTWAAEMHARDGAAGLVGRHYTLPAVPPDDVPRWAASADVSLVPAAAVSLNHRLSTPNKFWESIAGGTPVVVSQDLEVMAAIVESEGLGATFPGSGAAALAGGIRAVLDAPPVVRAATRARVLAAARERYNWDATVQPYLSLVERLVPARAERRD